MFNANLKRYCLILALCLLAVGIRANAQSTTEGAIAGTVFDANSAVVSGASVLIHNDGTNANVTLTSDNSGYFKQPLLSPGVYTVTVNAPGFKAYKATTVIVEVGKLTELQPHLPNGAASETIEVSTEAPIINYEAPDFASNLNEKAIDSLPINGRRWSDLTLLTPGVTIDTSGFGLLSFRGISTLLNNVQIDGADDNQGFYAEERGRTREGYSTAQVAVKEFQVNTGVYQAEFGRAAGGVVNSVTKSGTNEMHGELYFYDRDNQWGALNPYTNITTTTQTGPTSFTSKTSPYRPKDWRKQAGFGIGGPIVKDKIFWFYAFDYFKRNFPGTAVPFSPGTYYTFPDAALTGTQVCGANGFITGTPTTGAVSSIDQQACTLAARTSETYAAAVGTWGTSLLALSNGDLGTVLRTGTQVINTPKLDWQINSKQHLSFLYHRLRWDSPGGVQTQATNNYGKGTFGTDFVKLDYGLVKLDSLITNSITNELRYQYGRELNDEGLQPQTAYDLASLGSGNSTIPSVNLGSTSIGFNFGEPYYSFRQSYPDERKWQVADTLNWVHGNHTFKAGVDILHNYDLQNNLFEANGAYSYSYVGNYFADLYNNQHSLAPACNANGVQNGTTASPGTTGTAPCYSSFVVGAGKPAFDLATTDYGFFVQDTYKITPRVTLDLGVRYDYEAIPAPYQSTVNAAVGQANATTGLPYNGGTTNKPNDKNNIGPRVGFAYDVFGSGNTVLRGGFGMYYGRVWNAMIMNAYFNSGLSTIQGIPGQATVSYTSTTVGAPVFPRVPTSTTTFLAPPNVQFFDKNFQNPLVNEFDLAVQQKLSRGTVLSISYLGAMGRELPNFININLNPTSTYQATLTPVANLAGQYGPLGSAPIVTTVYAGLVQTATGTTSTLNNPNYGAITKITSNINSSYNALVVEVQNKTYKLAQFDANYTWSRALDFTQNASTQASTNNSYDPYGNNRINYGPSIYNIPNRFVGWVLLHSPDHFIGWKKYILNGWDLNPLFQAQTGLPYSLALSGSEPNQCSGVGCLQKAGSGLNGAGIATFIPQIGRNTFHFRSDYVVDLRGEKEFALPYRAMHLELIGEAFNLFNHQNVTAVQTNGYSINTSSIMYSSSYGQASTFGVPTNSNSNYAYSQRQIQLAVRLKF